MKITLVLHVKICKADVFILEFLIFLFPVCSFYRFYFSNIAVYQVLTSNKQVFKKSIMSLTNKVVSTSDFVS